MHGWMCVYVCVTGAIQEGMIEVVLDTMEDPQGVIEAVKGTGETSAGEVEAAVGIAKGRGCRKGRKESDRNLDK